MNILITGANGFVGSALVEALVEHRLTRVVRRNSTGDEKAIGDIDGATDWASVLAEQEVVVHLAARVHVMRDSAADPAVLFRKINTDATLRLAHQAAAAGVRRFVFISTAKVHGEGRNSPYQEQDVPAPDDAYARSKWEAEQGLLTLGAKTGMEIVILRPPLVYGPGARANFARLMRSVARGVPLPFGCIQNKRSLIFVGNLVDAIHICCMHPIAAHKTYLVSDGEDISTPELVRRLAAAMQRSARVVPVPVAMLKAAGVLFGKQKEVARLLGDFTVDSSAIRRELGWRPPFTLAQGLAKAIIEK